MKQALQWLKESDPRHYQILCLSSFFVVALSVSLLDVQALHIAGFIIAALLTQFIGDRFFKAQAWNWKSALITSLSLCLLLRVPSMGVAMLAASIAIGSKFILRVNNQHVFNPANLAIVASVLLFDSWISPGQWGHHAFLVLVFIGLGFWVSARAARANVAVIFLGSYFLMLLARALYLGDPLEIPVHQMQNGALLLFAFFMITDPKTSPNHRQAQTIYAVFIAGITYYFQFYQSVPQAMIYALSVCCLLVPLLNYYLPEAAYQWPSFRQKNASAKTKHFAGRLIANKE